MDEGNSMITTVESRRWDAFNKHAVKNVKNALEGTEHATLASAKFLRALRKQMTRAGGTPMSDMEADALRERFVAALTDATASALNEIAADYDIVTKLAELTRLREEQGADGDASGELALRATGMPSTDVEYHTQHLAVANVDDLERVASLMEEVAEATEGGLIDVLDEITRVESKIVRFADERAASDREERREIARRRSGVNGAQ